MSQDAIARLASAQEGNVTRAQLHDLGLSHAEVATCIRRGTLIRRFRGVFGWGHVPSTWRSLAFAAWLAYGPSAALSHCAGAGWLAVLPEPSGRVHVSRPAGGRSQPGTVLHLADPVDDVWHCDGLRVTSPARLLLDLAASQPRSVVERAWNQAQVRRLITPAQLLRAVEGWTGRRGVGLLQELLPDRGASRSVLEDRFRALVRRAGLPEPELNVWIEGILVDAVWRQQRVIVELDGRTFHQHDQAFEGDRRKANALQLAGWVVLRFTYRRIADDPASVVAEVLAALTR